jgi:hypothetical protein
MDAPHAAWRGAKARAVAEAERGVLDRVIAELSPMLARLGTERAP